MRAGLLTALLLAGPIAGAHAEPALKADLHLEVSADLDRVEGRARLTLTNTSAEPLSEVELWRFPERLATPPEAMTPVTADWQFPGGFDPARLHVRAVTSDGEALVWTRSAVDRIRVRAPRPVAPGERLSLEVQFTLIVPHRFGPFGRANGELILDGGFFPRPPPLGAGGFLTTSPPDDIDYQVSLTYLGESALAVVNGRVTKLARGRARQAGQGRAQRICLVLLTEHHHSGLIVDGTEVHFLHRRPRRYEGTIGDLADPAIIDVHAQTLGTVGAALRFLRREVGIAPPSRVLLVEGSLRRDVALAAPKMVLVSDRAFEVLGVERLRKFHRIAIVRALVSTLLAPRVLSGQPLSWRDRALDLAAVHLSERWETKQYGGQESAKALLEEGSFVAAVDEVIYAPQLPFPDVYFRALDDTDPYRDHLTLFSHDHPSGRRLHEKLKDLAPPEAISEAVDTLIAPGSPPLPELLERAAPGRIDDRFHFTWGSAYPEVNYRLGEVRRVEEGGRELVEVEVLREGTTSVREPVEVLVRGGSEGPQVATWDEAGARGVVRVETDAEDPVVTLDPRARLLESDLGLNVDPRFDNRNYDDWKFLIQGIYLTFTSTEGRPNAVIRTVLQRKYDLTHAILLEPFDLSTGTGLATTWLYYFGPKVRPNRRRDFLTTHLVAERLKPGEDQSAGFGLRADIGFGTNDYTSRAGPEDGSHALIQAGGVFAVDSAGNTNGAGFARAAFARLLDVAPGHVFGGRLDLSTQFGEASRQQRWTLGGPGKVRAFDPLGATGRHRILASAEWRHRFTRDVNINVAQLAWAYRIHGVLFADIALLDDSYEDLFRKEAVFLGVGYGLRFVYLLFGLNPYVLSLDFGVPIYHGRPVAGSGLPLTIVLSFDQAF